MRTVLIADDSPVPSGLRSVVERGSTSLVERRARELTERGAEPVDAVEADRIVFWSASPDPAIAELAERYASAEAAARREMLVFVTAERGGATASAALSPHEVFLWPRDEDRLKMAFLTGA